MFQDIAVGRDRQDRRRTRLPMDKALLGVEWRFLAHASDEEPGFCTAWLQRKSLRWEAECREREYRNGILAGFADEFGMASTLPSRQVGQGVDDPSDLGDADEKHGNIDGSTTGNVSISSQTARDMSLLHPDIPISSEDPLLAGVSKGPPLPALVVALKKGGVRLNDLQGGDRKPAEDAGSWDGIDLASAPCLQERMAADDQEDVECSAKKVNAQGNAAHGQPVTAHTLVRPSTPPTLLVYRPCLSIKIADDVPSELQDMSKLLETKANWVQRAPSELDIQQPSSEIDEEMARGAMHRLKIGITMNNLSPTLPNGTRKRSGGRTMIKRKTEASSGIPITPPSLQDTQRKSADRVTSYGKAWYINPEQWGLVASPQSDNAILAQDDGSAGEAKLLAHTTSMKERIPALFSAIEFAKYIRQKGFRMPAHLENADNAIKADETRRRQRRQPRTAGRDEDENEKESADENEKEDRQEDRATGAGQTTRRRTRVNAAMILKEGERKTHGRQESAQTTSIAPADGSCYDDVIREASWTTDA